MKLALHSCDHYVKVGLNIGTNVLCKKVEYFGIVGNGLQTCEAVLICCMSCT